MRDWGAKQVLCPGIDFRSLHHASERGISASDRYSAYPVWRPGSGRTAAERRPVTSDPTCGRCDPQTRMTLRRRTSRTSDCCGSRSASRAAVVLESVFVVSSVVKRGRTGHQTGRWPAASRRRTGELVDRTGASSSWTHFESRERAAARVPLLLMLWTRVRAGPWSGSAAGPCRHRPQDWAAERRAATGS